MLATGGSASAAIRFLKDRGVTNIKSVHLLAAPEGIKRLNEDHPDVEIYIAGLDENLTTTVYRPRSRRRGRPYFRNEISKAKS